MKQLVVTLFSLFLSHSLIAKTVTENTGEAISYTLGHSHDIKSKILNENRKLLIHLPEEYHQSNKTYPVLYVLDGNRHFRHAVNAVTLLKSEQRMPATIIVGITNNSGTRGRDLSREKDKFVAYIQDEVMVYMSQNFRVANINTLFGHSMAGLFALDILATTPELFTNYISASPALRPKTSSVLTSLPKVLNQPQRLNKKVFITMTDEMSEVGGAVQGLDEVMNLLKENAPVQLDWSYHFIGEQVHMTTPYLTMFSGLSKVFNDYQHLVFSDHKSFENNGGMDAVESYYQKRAKKYALTADVSLETYTNIANNLLDDGKQDEAIKMLVNTQNMYPHSAPVYDDLARAYEASEKLQEALSTYQRAVALASDNFPRWQPYYKRQVTRIEALIK